MRMNLLKVVVIYFVITGVASLPRLNSYDSGPRNYRAFEHLIRSKQQSRPETNFGKSILSFSL